MKDRTVFTPEMKTETALGRPKLEERLPDAGPPGGGAQAEAKHTFTRQPPATQEEPPAQPCRRIVAIDGPAGAGKSTVAARLAEQFGLLNLETGAMYRAFALKVLRAGLDPDNGTALEALSRATTITLEPGPCGNRVLLDQSDVTAYLRSPEVTQAASRVSVHAPVRSWMVALQQELGARGNVVMEGRDIGTAVFPDADVKVFLDASPEARSQRRYQQGAGSTGQGAGSAGGLGSGLACLEASAGLDPATAPDPAVDPSLNQSPDPSPAELQHLTHEMRERDQRDRNRAQSPLRPADDAIVIDSTTLSLDQVVDRVSAIITARWAQTPSP